MDPFTEKDLIENLKRIASSLEGIHTELADLNVAIREIYPEEEEEGVIKFEDADFEEEDEEEDETP